MISLANCLKPKHTDITEEEIKKVISKYVDKIPEIEPQFVIDEGLSKVISHYFEGKITTFPLYRISLKLDRNPVNIPWTLADNSGHKDSVKQEDKKVRTYKYVKHE